MDTLAFRVHRPSKYPIILESIQRLRGGKGLVETEDKPEFKEHTQSAKFWLNMNLDSLNILQWNVKAKLPSSSGGVAIMYDEQRDFIHFEFSVPKFYFGNNVCEIIPAFQSKYYGVSKLAMYDQTRYWYRCIVQTIYKIFFELTQGLFDAVEKSDVQIVRIDITFNQIFDSMDDALHYLEALSREQLPRLKDRRYGFHDGAITAQPASSDWYWKVYHKGKEVANQQADQIRKNFQETADTGALFEDSNIRHSFEQLPELQKYADRMLRYELECKGGLLSYLYNHNLKKKRIPAYKKVVSACGYLMREENYPVLRHFRIDHRGQDGKLIKNVDTYIGLYTIEYSLPRSIVDPKWQGGFEMVQVTESRLLSRILRISRVYNWLKHNHKVYNLNALKRLAAAVAKDNSMGHTFFLALPDGTVDASKAILKVQDTKNIHYDVDAMTLSEETPNAQVFSPSLLHLCILKHNQMFQSLQFNELPSVKSIELKAKEYNLAIDKMLIEKGKKKPKKVNVNRIKILQLMLKTMTWAEIRKSGNYHRTTVFRSMKDFNLVMGCDISANFTAFKNLDHVPRRPSELYFRHYNEMMQNKMPLSIFLQNCPFLLSL